MAARKFKTVAGGEAEFVLEVETQEFEKRQAELRRQHPGKVVIFRGTRLIGTFDTMDEAIREAISRFGNSPCLIRPVDSPPLSKAGFVLHSG